MNQAQFEHVKNAQGFIAALDQSGGSTPKALKAYGINEDQYSNDTEMFDLVHDMRTRIMTSPAFTSEKILGAILFEQTIDRQVAGKYTPAYLAEKGIVPFLKIDKGLADEENGVQLMKPIPGLEGTLAHAVERGIFGTKERSFISAYNKTGITAVIEQQFDVGRQVLAAGLIPIIEPEVNIHAEEKAKIETFMRDEILKHLDALNEDEYVMLKVTIPTEANSYASLIAHPRVLRVVALSGGYSREEANQKLAQNTGLIASFSRALSADLSAEQTDADFKLKLQEAIDSIYAASIK